MPEQFYLDHPDEDALTAALQEMLDEHCAEWGHEWRLATENGKRVKFCVKCNADGNLLEEVRKAVESKP